jgi:hypothetical protein
MYCPDSIEKILLSEQSTEAQALRGLYYLNLGKVLPSNATPSRSFVLKQEKSDTELLIKLLVFNQLIHKCFIGSVFAFTSTKMGR